jgi:DedD protein
MAAKASPEASEIRRRGRQRLIGAVALVMVLVVVVPMVLDSEPKAPRNEPSLDMPSKDSAPPLPAPPAAKAPVAAEPRPAPAAPVATVTPSAPPDAKVLSSTPPKVPAAAPAPGKAPAPALEGFAVQVGAFRDEARLAQARQKLALSGIVHYTERLDAQGGALTRLRAGPFPTREAAEAALVKLKRASLDGKVVSLP